MAQERRVGEGGAVSSPTGLGRHAAT
jgi:hypothetical protein